MNDLLFLGFRVRQIGEPNTQHAAGRAGSSGWWQTRIGLSFGARRHYCARFSAQARRPYSVLR